MDMKETATGKTGTPSALEKIAGSYTKMPDVRSGDYNIDKSNCESCGCIDMGNWVMVISPVGVAGIASASGAGIKVLAVTNSYPEEKLSAAWKVVPSLHGIRLATLNSLF